MNIEIKEFLNLLPPFIGIATGLFIKFSKNELLKGLKKYWWLIILIGIMSFVLRLFHLVGN